MKIQIYLIKSGHLLEVIKSYIKAVDVCTQAYADYATKFGAGKYIVYGEKMSDISLSTPPEGWTKPSGEHQATHPKKNAIGYEEMKNLPMLPDDQQLIIKHLKFPVTIHYRRPCTEGRMPLTKPQTCKFLYSTERDIYALCVPDIASALAELTASGAEITNGADTWVPPDGLEPISIEQFNLAVNKNKVA